MDSVEVKFKNIVKEIVEETIKFGEGYNNMQLLETIDNILNKKENAMIRKLNVKETIIRVLATKDLFYVNADKVAEKAFDVWLDA